MPRTWRKARKSCGKRSARQRARNGFDMNDMPSFSCSSLNLVASARPSSSFSSSRCSAPTSIPTSFQSPPHSIGITLPRRCSSTRATVRHSAIGGGSVRSHLYTAAVSPANAASSTRRSRSRPPIAASSSSTAPSPAPSRRRHWSPSSSSMSPSDRTTSHTTANASVNRAQRDGSSSHVVTQ